MNKIIIEPKNRDELESLEAYLKQNGILFTTEDEYQLERQKQLMNIFSGMVAKSPETFVTDREIDQVVEEIRAKRYEENRS